MGVGLDNFPYAFTEYVPRVDGVLADIGLNRDPHNIFLANLAELGIPGLLLFISLLVAMWRMGGRIEKTCRCSIGQTYCCFPAFGRINQYGSLQ